MYGKMEALLSYKYVHDFKSKQYVIKFKHYDTLIQKKQDD